MDGFIVAIDQVDYIKNDDIFQSIGAISANIIALAQNGIQIIKKDNNIKQIMIQAGDQLDKEGFTMILECITSETFLLTIFPTTENISIILFELNHAIQKLSSYIKGIEEHDDGEGIENII